jgi:hypothetical protein
LVEKWIPPIRSETAEIGQKTKGILGVKHAKMISMLKLMLQLCGCNLATTWCMECLQKTSSKKKCLPCQNGVIQSHFVCLLAIYGGSSA